MARNSNFLACILLICIISVVQVKQSYANSKDVLCDFQPENVAPLSEKSGSLVINPTIISNSTCAWLSTKTALLLHLKTIELDPQDKMVFKSLSSNKTQSFSFSGPGLVAVEEGDWKLEVHFGPSKIERRLNIDYSSDLYLKLGVPQVNNLTVYELIGSTQNLLFNVDIVSTAEKYRTLLQLQPQNSTDFLHIRSPSYRFVKAGFILSATNGTDMQLQINSRYDLKFRMIASDVLNKCSSLAVDPVDDKFKLTYPVVHSSTSYPYRNYYNEQKPNYKEPFNCVKMVSMSDSDATVRVDFSKFENLAENDKLILTDSRKSVVIRSGEQNLFENKYTVFEGNQLVILYKSEGNQESDNFVTLNGMLFLADQKPGWIRKPKMKSLRYVNYFFEGKPYASIVLGHPLPLTVSMKIFADNLEGQPLVTFLENEALPPVIALRHNKTLVVEFSAKIDEALTELPYYEFKVQSDSCNKLSTGQLDYLSISNMTQNECTWLIDANGPSGSTLALSLDKFGLPDWNDGDCVHVVKLSRTGGEKVIANPCGKREQFEKGGLLLNSDSKYYVRLTKDPRTHSLSFEASYSFVQKCYYQNSGSTTNHHE